MQEMDNVVVTVEKEKYARDGVHKGMYGWICHPRCVEGYWLVNFPQCGEKDDIAEISIKETDLMVAQLLDARVNERIKDEYENTLSSDKEVTNDSEGSDDLSGFMI